VLELQLIYSGAKAKLQLLDLADYLRVGLLESGDIVALVDAVDDALGAHRGARLTVKAEVVHFLLWVLAASLSLGSHHVGPPGCVVAVRDRL